MFVQRYDKKIITRCSDKDTSFPIEVLNQWDVTDWEIIGGNFSFFPDDISILKNLKKLSLVSTKVSNLPKDIFLLPKLKYLSLKNNRIQTLPDLDSESFIETLILGHNFLPNKTLERFLGRFPELYNLDLGHNIIDEIPESIFELKNLKRLNLESNRLKTIPLKLKEKLDLVHLSIDNNQFSHTEKLLIEKHFHIKF
ncbi:MAG: hypothetical protein HOP07_03365 [Bacteriovoracaceae bacterium]|nr:hypothetical protein [Bacteriovoracaceae bacterium]